jgi:TonB-dependent starch-binding outer membrane protein SusC
MIKRILSSLSALAFVLFVGAFSSTANAQTGTLTGTVTDQATGETLVGATVLITELERGAPANIDGVYRVENIPVGTYNIRYSFVGYRTVNRSITIAEGQNTVDVELRLDAAGLDEVVVTGVATIDRQAFTGTASTVRTDRFENVAVASVDQALQGNASGVIVSGSTGTPGAVQNVRIRGISSVNAGVSPLYVIDGVPVVSGNNASSGATSSLGIISNINPADIESITVLKDAASTAAYGARGSNGVIVITTKKGSEGRTQYSASAQIGFNNRAVRGEKPMDAATYDEIVYEAYENANPVWTRDFLDGLQPGTFSGWDGETDTNWGDVVRNDDAVSQEYTLSARGGSESTNFYISGALFGQEGALIGSKLDRYSGKIDVEHRFDDRVRISNSFTGSMVDQEGILEGAGYFGSPVLAEYFMLPFDRAYNDDGSANIDDLSVAIFNPVYIQDNDISRKRNFRAINNTNLTINLLDNMAFSSRFSVDFLETAEKYYRNPFYGDADDLSGSVNDINTRNSNLVWQNSLSYIWNMNEDNSFTFRGISETQKNYWERLSAYGTGIAADGLVNLNTTALPEGVGGSTTDWGVQSFTGLVNYGFQNKLFSDVSFRYEGNSRFAADQRWGSFWSVGVGYILTEEDLFRDLDFLDYLRVRASFGKTGNASIGLNQYQATVGFGSYFGVPTIQTTALGNQNLSWETAYALDVGVEFELFEAVSGGVTFFRKESKDLLFNVPLSRTTGHTSQTQNIGELYNQGLEVDLNVNVVRTSNISWTLGGNLTTLKNEVTKLPVDGDGNKIELTTATRYQAVEGYEVNAWFMQEWAGVDPDNGDPLWYMDDGNGGRTTTNNYNEADTYYQGASALPTLFGGINTRLDVQNFYVSANMYYGFGNKVYDNWANYMRSDGRVYGSFGQYARQADRWQQPGDIAENPRPVAGGNSNSFATSSRYLYDGDHLRLKDLLVGYNIPRSALSNIGLTSATVYFQGRNLWTHMFDDSLNMDPEAGADGFTELMAPTMKSVTFGIKFNF